LHEVTLRIAEKSKTLARDFDDAFAEFRFGLNLFAPFGTGLRPLAPTRGGPVKGLDLSNRAGRIGINWRRICDDAAAPARRTQWAQVGFCFLRS
jgi:hypothetical protein